MQFMHIHKNAAKNSEGFGLVGLLLIILSLALLAGGGFFTYQRVATPSPEVERPTSITEKEPGDEVCRTENVMKICASLADVSPPYADGYRLSAEFHNTSNEAFEYTFSSGCTSPTRIVNGSTVIEDALRGCTDAITPISVDPDSRQNFTSTFSPSMLDDGQNIIQLNWAGLETPEFKVNQLELTEEDKALLRERCIGSQTSSNGCELLTLQLGTDSMFNTISELDDYLQEQYGLGLHYSQNSPDDEPMFLAQVSVPAFELEYYEQLLREDPAFDGVIGLPM